ncbi:MAG TPA: ABC transporter substrate-binding protein, partial [Achromobacter sp.]|nr:ABC transporter substrate-binding protein [Achromobacter sp.]
MTSILPRTWRAVAPTSAAAWFSLACSGASAGEFPDHPIRWLVPFSAGGGRDIATRIG